MLLPIRNPPKRPRKRSPATKHPVRGRSLWNCLRFAGGSLFSGELMQIQGILIVASFMGLPAICSTYSWVVWNRNRNSLTLNSWKEKILALGLCLGTLCLILISAFLGHEYHADSQSFIDPPKYYWLFLNWISVLSWLFVCLAAALGRGALRLPLSVWCLTMPLCTYNCMYMGFIY